MGSAVFDAVAIEVDAASDYFFNVLQIDTGFLLDYTNEEFAATPIYTDARIPAVGDTRTDRDNYYQTPALTFLPTDSAYWVVHTLHRADTGYAVTAPIRSYIRDGSIAAPPASIDGDTLWAAFLDIAKTEPAANPDNLGEMLMVVGRYFCEKKALDTNSGLEKLYDDAGTGVLLQATVSTSGGVQTVGALDAP